jgi:NADP-dependent 3-hydroxy acid dehydrogenase YdfG
MTKIILVTGASSGLGPATVTHSRLRGIRVYGTSRNINKVEGANFKLLEMDVTDDGSVGLAIDKIVVAGGKINVVINNAGNGITGPFYDTPV